MAINKVINKSTKSHGAMRNVIEYVLQTSKIRERYIDIIGPYSPDEITWDGVYNAFLSEKKLWNKDSGRMYAHNIISFHKDEKIAPETALEIGRKFIDKFFPGYQSLLSVHQDKDHLHVHIITNSVSYIDGKKLHQSKRDLENQKLYTNELCEQYGLSIAEKGKHYNGSALEEGEVITWSKDKYNLLRNENKKSYVAECAMAVLEVCKNCCSKESFIERMLQKGWSTIWTDRRKHITFENEKGQKVRDCNLSKSFSLNINKEDLINEFKRQDERQRTELYSGSDVSTEQLDKYYQQIEYAVAGTNLDCQAGRNNTTTESNTLANQIPGSGTDTTSLVRKIRTEIDHNRSQDIGIRNSEHKSITIAEQQQTETKQRSLAQERATRSRRKTKRLAGPEL